MLQYVVILGAVANLVGIFSYIRDTLRGETKPNRVSWLMWSIVPMIATVAAIRSGVTWAVLPGFIAGFGPFLVLLASFANRKAYWKLEYVDYVCGALSAMALILWAVTKNPSVAIVLAMFSDTAAAIPTLVKAWKKPATVAVAPFATGVFSSLTGFFAVKAWVFPEYGFTAYLLFINALLMVVIARKFLKRT